MLGNLTRNLEKLIELDIKEKRTDERQAAKAHRYRGAQEETGRPH